ncbi:MAG: transcriptional regulator [Sphingobacteriales bacterium]|nr:MAG: transcriptional regulator [Sphingobacteriales bacterium]
MECPETLPRIEKMTHECQGHMLPVRDALDILSGKWKLPIIIALMHGNYRFKEMERMIEGITPKMLSKELRELEMNKLVNRTVYDTTPVTVEYELTDNGKSLKGVIQALGKWGHEHRARIMPKKSKT